jgi:pimeloyl-ACP methyl ester carboxylesterase
MHTILLIPGILGSKLKLGSSEIWPPNLAEALTHYKRVKKLLNPRVVPAGIIREIAWVQFYGPLERTLIAIARKMKPKGKVEIFDYDWRMGWLDTSKALNKKLERLAGSGSEISIVGHSMGAMIARLSLENPSEKPSWRPKVKKLIAICGPHLGAPHAVADALGLHGMADEIVRPSDTKKIAADPRYPSGYQLFTRPGTDVVLEKMTPVDIYDPKVAKRLDLAETHILAARDLFPLLDLLRQPPTCDYRFISANGYDTINYLNIKGRKVVEELYFDGDKTVPVWSTNPSPSIPNYTMEGTHLGVTKTPQCKALLYRLFGFPPPGGLFMIREGTLLVTLSVDKLAYDRKAVINLLVIPGKPAKTVSGELQLFRAEDKAGRRFSAFGSAMKFEHRGLRPLKSIKDSFKAPSEPGVYKLTFGGVKSSHATDNETAAYFVVRKEPR